MIELNISVFLEISFIFLSILAEIPLIKSWLKRRNRIDVAILILLGSLQLSSIFRIIFAIDLYPNLLFGELLSVLYILSLIVLTIEVDFLFYLKDWKRFYSFPVVISFYTGLGLFLVDFIYVYILYTIVVALSSFILFLKEGKKNKNGLALSLGLFIMVYGIAIIFMDPFISSLLHLISMILLFLGTSGTFDKVFPVDEEEEQKIKNVWVSSMVSKKNEN